MQNLTNLRKEIDEIDEKIRNLLEMRFKIVAKVAKCKLMSKAPLKDNKREKEILEKCKSVQVKEVFKKILVKSRRVQLLTIKGKNAKMLQ